MKKIIPCVTPKYLLLIAGIVWMFAGGNILRIGVPDFIQYWQFSVWYLLGGCRCFSSLYGTDFLSACPKAQRSYYGHLR